VVTSGRETPSEGVAPSVGNAGEKLAGGESAPLAGGESAPLAGGESAPLAGGEGAPLAGGEGAPLAGGEGAPLAGGEGAPLAGGEGAPLAGGEGAPLAGGEGAPLAAGVQQLEPQGQDAAADTLQGEGSKSLCGRHVILGLHTDEYFIVWSHCCNMYYSFNKNMTI